MKSTQQELSDYDQGDERQPIKVKRDDDTYICWNWRTQEWDTIKGKIEDASHRR